MKRLPRAAQLAQSLHVPARVGCELLALKSHVGRITRKDLAPIGAAFAEELDTILTLAGKSVGPYRVEV